VEGRGRYSAQTSLSKSNFGLRTSQLCNCTARNRREYRVSRVHKTSCFLRRTESRTHGDIAALTAQSYQYVRRTRLLQRVQAGPQRYILWTLLQCNFPAFRYMCVLQFLSFTCCFCFTRVGTARCGTEKASKCIATRRRSHSGAAEVLCLLGCDAVSFGE
jgi:hypothetical protein